jgi:hypothetical protein
MPSIDATRRAHAIAAVERQKSWFVMQSRQVVFVLARLIFRWKMKIRLINNPKGTLRCLLICWFYLSASSRSSIPRILRMFSKVSLYSVRHRISHTSMSAVF